MKRKRFSMVHAVHTKKRVTLFGNSHTTETNCIGFSNQLYLSCSETQYGSNRIQSRRIHPQSATVSHAERHRTPATAKNIGHGITRHLNH